MFIIFGADIVPTEYNSNLFCEGNARALVGDVLLELINNAECRIFNLEAPFSDENTPIPKCGPSLKISKKAINGYLALKSNILLLSNNHIMDQGNKGLKSTIDLLDEVNITHIGAGEQFYQAKEPGFIWLGDKKIGIYNCTQHEFSYARNNRPGANAFDPLCSLDEIHSAKDNCDYLVVVYHGGEEHYRYPTPGLQAICRKMCDKGAQLVLCQHSHCIGCMEDYQDSKIIYGQGNFIFDHQDNEFWNSGLLVSLDEKLSIDFHPFVKSNHVIRACSKQEHESIMKGFYDRSTLIEKEGYIEESFKSYSKEVIDSYLGMFGGKESLLYRIVNRLLSNKLREMRVKRKYTIEQRLMLLNYIECEAHREVIISGLEK